MNTPENNSPEKNLSANTGNEAGVALHEMLCAYLLGEADANETLAVEKALAESSELRAERARLEQTMGLVREAFPGGEALSESAFAEVLAKAQDAAHTQTERPAAGRPRLVLLRSNWIRAAAAVLVVGFGAWVFQALEGPGAIGTTGQADTSVASSERPNAPEERAKNRELADRAEPKRQPQDLQEAQAGRRDAVASRLQAGKEEGAQLEALGYGQAAEQEVEPLEALGYASDDKDGSGVLGDLNLEGREVPQYAARTSGEKTLADEESLDWLAGLGYAGGESDASTPAPAASADKRYLGPPVAVALESRVHDTTAPDGQLAGGAAGALSAPAGRNAPAPGTPMASSSPPAVSGRGTYKGPGDSVPPGGGQSVATGSDTFFLGKGKKADEGEVGALAALGYGGGENESDDGWSRRSRARQFEDSPVDREAWIREQCRVRIRDCYPRPHENPRDMYFRFWGDNAFQLTELDALSTFSVDVDTASYALARRYLSEGHLPTKAQIRTEEFLNYFDPDLAPPSEGTFAIHTELAPSRFGGDTPRSMLRVGIRGREVPKAERKPLSLTFVVDTSGSMRENNRLELVKHAVRLLVGELDGRDSIAIVAYSNEARVVLPLTPASQGGVIETALFPLQPNGSTNAEAGLKLGYEVARTGLVPEKNHRVVFLSDGVANVGQTDQDRIARDVKRHLDAGIYLNTIGVGMNNHNDVFLEQLANKGDGVCDYVDSPKAAQRAIVERFTGAFEPIASDVKIQVEFDPKQVHRYRLLGYENRAIADQDFRNDAVDAGEVGAGHQVVALYELELTGDEASEAPLATVRLRYKAPKAVGQDPREVDVTELEQPVTVSAARESFAKASAGYRRSVVVAQFAEFLRRSSHTYEDSFEALLSETAQLARELADPDFDEFLGLVQKAYQLGPPADYRGDLDLTLDEFRRFQILRKELESLNRELDGELLQELQRRNQELEGKLRELIRGELDKNG